MLRSSKSFQCIPTLRLEPSYDDILLSNRAREAGRYAEFHKRKRDDCDIDAEQDVDMEELTVDEEEKNVVKKKNPIYSFSFSFAKRNKRLKHGGEQRN